jgi:hypothetical protein
MRKLLFSSGLVLALSGLAALANAVRYGWTRVPEVNLLNREGLPATPFRTDVK